MTTYDPGPECILCGGTGGWMSFTPTPAGTIHEHTKPKDCIESLRWRLSALADRVQQLEYERTLRRS